MIELGLIVSAFIAGIIMFLAPCTLPLVPAYLGFISGTSLSELQRAEGEDRRRIQRTIFLNGLGFVIGFTLIFVFFGVLAGLLGGALVPLREWLTRIGGVLVIVFGLSMLGVFRIRALSVERRISVPKFFRLGNPLTSSAIGALFAFGWTPCVGPILATILFLASNSATAFSGGVLLFVFSLGLAIPFLLVAGATAYFARYIERGNVYVRYISYVGGVFLIGIGLLLLTNTFAYTIQYGYTLLEFINYEALLEYL